jgi:hypothetical protein
MNRFRGIATEEGQKSRREGSESSKYGLIWIAQSTEGGRKGEENVERITVLGSMTLYLRARGFKGLSWVGFEEKAPETVKRG